MTIWTDHGLDSAVPHNRHSCVLIGPFNDARIHIGEFMKPGGLIRAGIVRIHGRQFAVVSQIVRKRCSNHIHSRNGGLSMTGVALPNDHDAQRHRGDG